MVDKIKAVSIITFLVVLMSFLLGCAHSPPSEIKNPTAIPALKPPLESTMFEKYGKNIIYYSFYKIPKNINLQKDVPKPKDLEKYLANPLRDRSLTNPLLVADPQRFQKDIREEMANCGYGIADFQKMNMEEAVLAAVKITCSRIEYGFLDENKFRQKYQRKTYIDDNFHFRIGDCDKYTDLTITIFDFIKKFNPRLKNVYLLHSDLGGNIYTEHMWVAILIVQDSKIILSHIDPTFYDVGRQAPKKLLADDDWYITLENDVFKACFYRELEIGSMSNLLCAYDIFEKAYARASNKKLQEKILENMNFTAFKMAVWGYPKIAMEKNGWVMNQYTQKKFGKHRAAIIFNNFWIYKLSGDKKLAEQCKEELREKYPKKFLAIKPF